jgi:hypothetical protein
MYSLIYHVLLIVLSLGLGAGFVVYYLNSLALLSNDIKYKYILDTFDPISADPSFYELTVSLISLVVFSMVVFPLAVRPMQLIKRIDFTKVLVPVIKVVLSPFFLLISVIERIFNASMEGLNVK